MSKEYTSLKQIGDRLLRNSVLTGLSWESIVDYVVDFLDIIGIPDIYIENFYEHKIENYKVTLPCDFIEEVQVLFSEKNNSFHTARYATDTMHEHYDKIKPTYKTDYTFSINNTYMYTSIKEGIIRMNYKAIITDEEGYPMMPSNRVFMEALEWFIKLKYYTILWEEGRLEDKRLQNTQSEYAWAVGRLETNMKKLSLSKAESFFNSFSTLVPKHNEFSKQFANTGTKEFIRRH